MVGGYCSQAALILFISCLYVVHMTDKSSSNNYNGGVRRLNGFLK